MNLNYAQAMEFLNSLPVFTPEAVTTGSRSMNLDSIRILLQRLNNPEKKMKYVHVAGTNGKGSTCAFLSQILTENKIRTGRFTSPALFRFTENICVDGNEIEQEDVGRLMTTVKKEADRMASDGNSYPSEFEITLALAFLYFAEKKCKLVILEAGLGGSMDATNVIESPLLAVFTAISYDHMQLLGSTLTAIAENKAGIIKENTMVLTYPQEPEVMKVLQKACDKTRAVFETVILPEEKDFSDGKQTFYLEGVGELTVFSAADYQPGNASLAVAAALKLKTLGYDISIPAMQRGVMNTRWRGRFEILEEKPAVIADGSHNVQGIEALVRNLQRLFPGKKIYFVVGVFADKQYQQMMDRLLPLAEKFYVITPPSPRALEKEKLCAYLGKQKAVCETVESIPSAVSLAKEAAKTDDVVCICGSLSFHGQIYS